LKNPSIAPVYEVETTLTFYEKMIIFGRDIVPVGLIIFSILGMIILGIATPTEAAAIGATTSLILAKCYGNLNYNVIKKALYGSLRVSGMIFLIVAGSGIFSQIMAFTGITSSIVETVSSLAVSKTVIVIAMLGITLILGCFMETFSIVMVTIPMFMPVINTLGIDPLWFLIMYMVALETGVITPPFGMSLYIMDGITPDDIKLTHIYRSSFPYVICNLAVIGVLMLFPKLTTLLQVAR